MRGQRVGGSARHDQVHLGVGQLGGQGRQPLVAALRPAVLEGDVLPLDPPAPMQLRLERAQQPSVLRGGRAGRQMTDPVDLADRLGGRGEGPGQEGADEGPQERATLHHHVRPTPTPGRSR